MALRLLLLDGSPAHRRVDGGQVETNARKLLLVTGPSSYEKAKRVAFDPGQDQLPRKQALSLLG